jgi:hypothetical protein
MNNQEESSEQSVGMSVMVSMCQIDLSHHGVFTQRRQCEEKHAGEII